MNLDTYQELAQSLINQSFNNPQLLRTAFTHCSYINENRRHAQEHNERLEFLGDAVLEIVVTDYLYTNYNHPEGVLTNWRASLVRTESLAKAADKLEFLKHIRLSKGEKKSSSRAQQQMLANTFEAVIGAIYLDKGYKSAKHFIDRHIISTLPDILKIGSWIDAKTRLQEHIQNTQGQTPVYRILNEEGPDHDKIFEVGVYIDDKLSGQGQGHSKQQAAQKAAQQALDDQDIAPLQV